MDTELATVGDVVASGYPDRLPGTSVVHAVRDNGQGMDADTLGKFFEPFCTTKGLDQDAGHGLATARGIVRQTGGFIEVQSAPGQGPVSRAHLPRHAETRADRAPEPQAPPGVPATGGPRPFYSCGRISITCGTVPVPSAANNNHR